MRIKQTNIPECYLIESFTNSDERGVFVKSFHFSAFREKACHFEVREMFYSWSKPNVFRGFHFHSPPHAHNKLVCCPVGAINDYVLDLRIGSPEYGKVHKFKLSESNHNALLIPAGCAHGFYVTRKRSLLLYLLETEYAPAFDKGILWSSLDYNFEFHTPLLSKRDQSFDEIGAFKSPFVL